MKIKQIETFKFSELSEKDKQKALENLYDINVDHDWWDYIYEDSERSGLKITGFDLDQRRHATGKFITYPKSCAQAFLKEHGNTTETYKTSETYLNDLTVLENNFRSLYAAKTGNIEFEDEDAFGDSAFENALEDLNTEFLRAILEDYSLMLQKDYEYLTSEKSIIETIEANDYDFTSEGKIA